MKTNGSEEKEQSAEQISTLPPAMELLASVAVAKRAWPSEITERPEFVEQVRAHVEFCRRLDVVLRGLERPDMELEAAVRAGRVTERQAADLYASLQEALALGSEYQRLLLYLPFELLPDSRWRPKTARLRAATETFRETYMDAWRGLLSVRDVRANFVDGDVLEVDKRAGDLPRVVKAAHLIPELLKREMISMAEVDRLAADGSETLRASVRDAKTAIKRMGMTDEAEPSQAPTSEAARPLTFQSFNAELRTMLRHVDARSFGDITPRREAWLKQDARRKAIGDAGKTLRDAILHGTFDVSEAVAFTADGVEPSMQIACVEGLREAIETAARVDTRQGNALFQSFRPALRELWSVKHMDVHDAMSKLFYRLHGYGILTGAQLNSIGLRIPALAGPFSENLKRMEPEMAMVKRAVETIGRDAELSKLVFPVVLAFGSRLKGYGAERSDVDVAVIVKPGVDPDKKAFLRARFKTIFEDPKIGGEAVEFWTEKVGDELRVRTFDAYDHKAGEKSWTSILFGAAWEGDAKTMQMLREKLLASYFYDDEDKIQGRDARDAYLEELERDLLQYRLMHKGYERYFPRFGGLDAPSPELDGDSLFWDSGYRQTATRLFVNYVFLPKLERKKRT